MNTHSYILCGYNSQKKLTFASYLHNTRIWIWIIAVNHPKASKFNKAFKFSVISLYYSYNIHNNIFWLVSHYPDFLITSCIHAFENYVQSIVLYGLNVTITWSIYPLFLKIINTIFTLGLEYKIYYFFFKLTSVLWVTPRELKIVTHLFSGSYQ